MKRLMGIITLLSAASSLSLYAPNIEPEFDVPENKQSTTTIDTEQKREAEQRQLVVRISLQHSLHSALYGALRLDQSSHAQNSYKTQTQETLSDLNPSAARSFLQKRLRRLKREFTHAPTGMAAIEKMQLRERITVCQELLKEMPKPGCCSSCAIL